MGDRSPEPQPVTLDADAAAHGRRADPLGLQDRPLLDVQLEVGVDSLEAGGAVEHALQLDAILGEDARCSSALGVTGYRELLGVEGPGGAGAAEQAAPEARALLVG